MRSLALNLSNGPWPHSSLWPKADLQILQVPGTGHSPARLCDIPCNRNDPIALQWGLGKATGVDVSDVANLCWLPGGEMLQILVAQSK